MFTEGKHSDKINCAHCPMIIQKRAPVVLQLVEKFENTIRHPNNGVRHISIDLPIRLSCRLKRD